MTTRADRVVLVVEDDPTQLEALKILLTNRALWTVEGVPGAREALDRMRAGPLAALVLDEEMPGMDGLTLLANLRRDVTTSQLPILILTASGEADIWRRAWALGADGVLQKPTHPAVLRSALEACVQRREDAAAVAEQLRLAEWSVTGLIDLLVQQLETIEPGSARRGGALVRLAEVMAEMYEVEPMHLSDLRRAAMLHAIARISTGLQAAPTGDRWPGLSGRETMASAAVLRQVPALEGVAEIVLGMGANWDGTGFPQGLEHGQIHVRSRILRAAHDLQAMISPPNGVPGVSLPGAIAALEMRSGTWYDPAAIAILHRVSMENDEPVWDPDVDLYAIDDLRVGMELASDLTTVSGVKLLSSGTRMTATQLDLIRRRHERDPISNRVPIRHRKE